VPLFEKLRIRNTLSEPMAAGTLRVYQAGQWVGEDLIQATPVGDETNVTVSSSVDVKGRLTLIAHEATSQSDVSTYRLTVTSHKTSGNADVHAVLVAPDYRTTILSAEPAGGETLGTRVAWDTTLAPGASMAWTLRYETQKY
jgi:hypothetical protein